MPGILQCHQLPQAQENSAASSDYDIILCFVFSVLVHSLFQLTAQEMGAVLCRAVFCRQ